MSGWSNFSRAANHVSRALPRVYVPGTSSHRRRGSVGWRPPTEPRATKAQEGLQAFQHPGAYKGPMVLQWLATGLLASGFVGATNPGWAAANQRRATLSAPHTGNTVSSASVTLVPVCPEGSSTAQRPTRLRRCGGQAYTGPLGAHLALQVALHGMIVNPQPGLPIAANIPAIREDGLQATQ